MTGLVAGSITGSAIGFAAGSTEFLALRVADLVIDLVTDRVADLVVDLVALLLLERELCRGPELTAGSDALTFPEFRVDLPMFAEFTFDTRSTRDRLTSLYSYGTEEPIALWSFVK